MNDVEINALVNEICMDAYADMLDKRGCDKFARVCRTKQNKIAFVILLGNHDGHLTMEPPSEYRRESLRWLTDERNQNTHAGARFDVIHIDIPTRTGRLFENAF